MDIYLSAIPTEIESLLRVRQVSDVWSVVVQEEVVHWIFLDQSISIVMEIFSSWTREAADFWSFSLSTIHAVSQSWSSPEEQNH